MNESSRRGGVSAPKRAAPPKRAGETASRAPRRASTVRAVALVAFGALAQAVVVPYLTLGLVAPALAVLCVVVAAAGLREPVGLLVGFFGGTLVDALGSGLFGVGALSGVLAAALSSRAGILGEKAATRWRLAGVVAAAVAAHDLVSVAALGLAGGSWPSAGLLLWGVSSDAILNGVLAYAVGGVLLWLVLVREKGWR